MEQLGGALIGGLLGDDGGGSSQTAERSPWAPAQPWMQNNITQGQELQNRYMTNPFSQQQQNAYSNAFGMSDAYRSMLPQLLAGLNSGTFDRTNPLQRPKAMSFGGFKPQTYAMGGFQTPVSQQPAMQATPQAAAPQTFSDLYQFHRDDRG